MAFVLKGHYGLYSARSEWPLFCNVVVAFILLGCHGLYFVRSSRRSFCKVGMAFLLQDKIK